MSDKWYCNKCGNTVIGEMVCPICFSLRDNAYNILAIQGDHRAPIEDDQKKILKYGLHKDEGKTRWDLMPWECLEEIAQVFTFGCTKYAERNWENGIHTGRLIGSAFRHIYEWLMGRDTDKESGIHHLAHAAWNIMAIRWMTMHKTEFVNRPNVEGNHGNLGKD